MKIKHVLATLALAGVMAVGVGAAIGLNAGQKVESVAAANKKTFFVYAANNTVQNCFNEEPHSMSLAGEYDTLSAHLFNGSNSVSSWPGVQMKRLGNGVFGLTFEDSVNANSLILNKVWTNNNTLDGKYRSTYDANDVTPIVFDITSHNMFTYSKFNCKLGTDAGSFDKDYSWSFKSSAQTVELSYNHSASDAQFEGTITLADNEVFTLTDTLGNAITTIESGTGSVIDKGYVEYVKEGDDIVGFKAISGGKYEIYAKPGAGKVWMQVGSDVEAASWAKGFVEGLNCDSGYTIAPNNWSTYSTSYGQLTDGAKHLLGDATANKNGTDIEKAAFMHDLCVSKYPTACPAFMQKTGGALRTAVITKNVIFNNVENNVSLVVIIAVASLSVLAAGGYFFYRKRKEN